MEYYIKSEKQHGCLGTEWLSVYWLFMLLIMRQMRGLWLTSLPHITRNNDIPSPGKVQNSTFEAQFLLNVYHFHTTVKPNHRNSGTLYHVSFYHALHHCPPFKKDFIPGAKVLMLCFVSVKIRLLCQYDNI